MHRILAYLLCRVFELVLAMGTLQLAIGLGRLMAFGPQLAHP